MDAVTQPSPIPALLLPMEQALVSRRPRRWSAAHRFVHGARRVVGPGGSRPARVSERTERSIGA
jgi:hypothetical protein